MTGIVLINIFGEIGIVALGDHILVVNKASEVAGLEVFSLAGPETVLRSQLTADGVALTEGS